MGPLKRFLGGVVIGTAMTIPLFLSPLPAQDLTSQAGEQEMVQETQSDPFVYITILILGLTLAGLGVLGTVKNKRKRASVTTLEDFRRLRARKKYYI